MAELIGGVGMSHVPSVGTAIDEAKTAEAYWSSYFQKLEPVREWFAQANPDVCLVVYNDHASAFDLNFIPTFALGVSDHFPPADEGYGPRPVPTAEGHPELAWHLVESLILNKFDLTIANQMPIDHGCTVPLSIAYGQPPSWPCRLVPLAVNVIQYPAPTGQRCYELGSAIRQALDAYHGDERVVIFGTGGMSHQLQGERAGLINLPFDQAFMDRLVANPSAQASVEHTEYILQAGSEGIELIMWLVMRGALDANVREVYRVNHVPTSNTSNGILILENSGNLK